MNLHKAYDTVDWVRLLKILDICGSGPHIRGLLAEFWELQEVVPGKTVTASPTSKQLGGKPREVSYHPPSLI